jgi:hypothetical protein
MKNLIITQLTANKKLLPVTTAVTRRTQWNNYRRFGYQFK